MNITRTLLPWVLFLIMSLLAAFFWHQSDQRGRRIHELGEEIQRFEKQLHRLSEDILDLKALAEEQQEKAGEGP
ncbi:MAG: hypothetical protein GX130_07960 [Candidatus Hydrogenedens sp.]|jgi:hypothetical protein|nr:hypothetical protein [Candidatus Hydrogenedens sp.]